MPDGKLGDNKYRFVKAYYEFLKVCSKMLPILGILSLISPTLPDIVIPRNNSFYRVSDNVNIYGICFVEFFKVKEVHMFSE